MKQIFILIITIILVSCATIKENKGLFESYNTYVNEIRKHQSNFILSMISKKRVNKINSLGEKEFPVLSSFPNVLFKIKSHYQKLENNKGCLTINGYGKNNNPILVSIKYLYENKKWVIDFVEIYYTDSAKEFQTKGICPNES